MRIFGFDLGTTSIGAAVVDFNSDTGHGSVVHLATRIFPEGVTEKDREPRNKARRAARLIRRQTRRRRARRAELGRLLAEAGLLPAFESSAWHTTMGSDPYDLRARGLTQPLEPFEAGRALYHLAKRRGFTSSRLQEETEEAKTRKKEEGVVKEQISKLRELMGGQTLGAYLATRERKRGDYIGRDMVKAEFRSLWEAQARHHRDRLTDSLHRQIEHVMFDQRPVFWRLNTLGQCALEPGEKSLCLKGSWYGQQFVMLQDLNHLRVAGVEDRILTSEERGIALTLLQVHAGVTFGALRKALGIHGERFNFEVGGKKKLRGNATEAVLRKIFGKAWEAHPGRDRLRREIAERLWAVSYKQIGNKRVELRPDADEAAQREHFIQTAQADFGVTLDQAVALVDIGGKLPPGWLRFSRKAVERLLIPLGEGKPITTAQAEVYPTYRDHKKESRERLPSRSTEMPDVRNPTVTRALTELRKVTNNLLAVYGKPGLIRIELARDLKLPKRIRVQIQKQQIDLEALREKAREDLLKNSIPATRESEEKWMLWKGCGETCPYTGRKIGFDALFRRGEFQVEHIFPRSRSLDNGFGNKTLCEANLNKEKGNRTPYELFATDPEKWNELKANLRSIGLPESKTRRFLNPRLEAEGSEELAERQLRDTSYIAREARVFLDRLGVPVQPTNGRVTAQLRHVWGLNTILGAAFGGKNRADHRHHAVDALVVALSTPTFIKRLSTYYSREQIAPGDLFPVPWPRMRQEAEAKVGEVVVSHRVRRKVSGALHRQTAYGDTGEEVTENGTTYRFFVSRVKLNGITSAQIGNIRDPVIRQLVDDHVRAHGEKPGGAFPPYPALVSKSDGTTREIRKVRVVFKQQKGLMAKLRPEGQAYADPSANHHIEIFAFGNGEVHHEIVTMFEAARRLAAREAIVRRIAPAGGKFIMSLCPGDAVEFPGEGEGPASYRIVTSVWASGQIVFEDHCTADGTVWKRPTVSSLLKMGVRKVVADPIGRVRSAHD